MNFIRPISPKTLQIFPPLDDWLVEMEPEAKNPGLACRRNLDKKLRKDFGVNTVSILQSLFRLGKGQIVCCTCSVYHLV